jgi:hypothetical protein
VDGLVINDALIGVTNLAVVPASLAPGEVGMVTATYTITLADMDAGMISNQALATGMDPNGDDVTDMSDDDSNVEDDVTITPIPQTPALAIIKTGELQDENMDGFGQVGETIDYTFTITNTGTVTLTDITVTDLLVQVDGGPIASLAPGEMDNMTFTASYTLTQADVDAGGVSNQALATGTDPNGDDVTDMSDDDSNLEDDITITEVPQNPQVILEKMGLFNDTDMDGFAEVGETITYTFVVTNVGNVTLTDLVINDPLVAVIGGPIASLAVGESDNMTFTATYVLTDSDILNGEVINSATVSGNSPLGVIVTDISDDRDNPTNVDTEGDGDPDDPTVTPFVTINDILIACIGEINVTLDENCQAQLLPEMGLTGQFEDAPQIIIDVDGTGSDMINGCGEYSYTIRVLNLLGEEVLTCWGTVIAEDKTSPVAVATPEDVTLLCVDFENDANNVSTLDEQISRCYRVNAETGATILGSMSIALQERLLAGGLVPLVPTFTDGCAQELEVCVSDVVVFGEDPNCDDITLTRTFVATEISTCVSAAGEGNAPAVATYDITFERPTLADLSTEGIEAVVTYEQCGSANPTRADYPAPRANDFPSLLVGDRILRLGVGDAVCNIGVTYADGDAIATCPFTYKFVRTYTVIDLCDPTDVRTFTQVVKVGDTTEPVFTGPNVETNEAGDLVYGTNAGNVCAAYIRLDDVSALDNCSGASVSISAEIFPGGNVNGASIGAFTVVPGGTPELSSAIPAGRHLLRYTTTDECGNASIDDFFFVVEDRTPPVALCEDGLNISITGGASGGFAVLTPANIDNGSYDDCSDVSLSIARVNNSDLPISAYGSQIVLTCADIGTVRVGLRVEDALGNVNYCWLDVLVEDKLAPTCIAPANTTIACTDYNTSLPADIQDATDAQLDALFGAAAGVDNCGAIITQTISGDVNSCGVGSFVRTFVSTDAAGFTNVGACTQRIDVIGVHDYRLTFPTDESGDCAENPVYAGVFAEELGCDLITTTTDVDTLRTLDAGDECFKLRITYDVVNWCEYNSLGEPFIVTRDGSGVNNRQRQPRDIDNDELFVNVIPNNTDGTGDDQAFMTLFSDRVFSPNAPQRDREFAGYAGSNRRGFFRYTQYIKVYDEVAPEITFTELESCFAGNNEGCLATVSIAFTALDECSEATVNVELDANYLEANGFNPDNAAALGIGVSVENDGNGNYVVTATNVPVGEHALRVRASDGCGNFDVQLIEFCVTADLTPTPICVQTLTVVLMNDGDGGGTAAIWASDFIASPIEDCFGNEVTKYSLFRSSDAGGAGFVPSFNPPTTDGIADIDCADFETGTVSVRVYAFDDNGTTPDYCEVVVEVQDNMGWCDDEALGNVAGLIADQDNVALENASVTLTGAMEVTTSTDASGQYSFTGLPLGADYTVQPTYEAPVNLRNVKSSDLVAMIGEILGTTNFDSPYDFVAADVNRDQELNIFDVVNVSQVILGQRDIFESGQSWVFVEANATINVANPYAAVFPEVYNANDLAGTVTANFVAVEMGNPFGLSSRTALNVTTDDAQLEAGQTHTIVLDGTDLAAFQGTLELGAGLELIGVEYTGEGGINLNRAGEGLIAIALRDAATVSLEVRATTAVMLSDQLILSDAITVREGVGANGVGNGLDLAFTTSLAPAAAQNLLHQNTPNPVRGETVIRFELAQAGAATLTLRDVAGRVVLIRQLEASSGLNTVELTNLNVSGVLTYTLSAGEFTASKKMVVVK